MTFVIEIHADTAREANEVAGKAAMLYGRTARIYKEEEPDLFTRFPGLRTRDFVTAIRFDKSTNTLHSGVVTDDGEFLK